MATASLSEIIKQGLEAPNEETFSIHLASLSALAMSSFDTLAYFEVNKMTVETDYIKHAEQILEDTSWDFVSNKPMSADS